MSAVAVDVFEQQSAVAQLYSDFAGAELPRNIHSNALAASIVVYSGACYLLAFTVNNTNAAAQYLLLMDDTTLPADGAVPTTSFTVAGSADKTVTWPIPGRLFQRGLVLTNSSTAGTKTIGSADCFFDVQYVPVVF